MFNLKKLGEIFVEMQLRELREYTELLEHTFRTELAQLEKRLEDQASTLAPVERDEFFELYSDDAWRLRERFPGTLRESVFIACCSLLENKLNRICANLYRRNGYSIQLSDVAGKGITRAQTYIKKVARMAFPDTTDIWRKIKYYMFPDVEPGAMPPFGNLYGLPVYVSEECAGNRWIAFNAGTHEEVVEMNYAEFARLAHPVALRLSTHDTSMLGIIEREDGRAYCRLTFEGR